MITVNRPYTLDLCGFIVNVDVESVWTVSTEAYGADADGLRGRTVALAELKQFRVTDNHGRDITEKLQTRWPIEYAGLSTCVDIEHAEAALEACRE